MNSASCAPVPWAAIRQLLLGAWQTQGLPTNLIKTTPSELFFGSYFEPHSLMSRFANGNVLLTLSRSLDNAKWIFQIVIFVSAAMLGAI